MNQNYTTRNYPIYLKVWNFLKNFPSQLSKGATNTPDTNGPAAAAILSATFSCFFLMVNQHIAMLSTTWKNWLWTLGAWIPGSHNPDDLYGRIGPYAGKATLLLLAWLASWLILHQFLKNRDLRPGTIFFWSILFIVAATVMNWHPLFPYAPLY
ncbi:hypothetical protein [Geitlerinema sp. PCC 9228]|uniref:hypothetical protein n=1 Tax=Geitlerinema sp. PCC 9228 TaxID=111611 RepID=UPI0008F99202|nr:hypothetical protein [Geitlerinema sp. PCC 9228]